MMRLKTNRYAANMTANMSASTMADTTGGTSLAIPNPSMRSAHMNSEQLMADEAMPAIMKPFLPFEHTPRKAVRSMRPKAIIRTESKKVKPKNSNDNENIDDYE